jgi:y4mF family transcriptional regulator
MKTIVSSRQLGILIKKIRKNNKITQKNLAAVCGTGVRFIQDLEKGKPSCELQKSLMVANMLGIKLIAHLPSMDIEEK